MNTFRAGILRALCVIALVHQAGYAEKRDAPHIFSNVQHIEEAGDLVGYELELVPDSHPARGIIRIYQGGCGDPVSLSGTNTGLEFHLRGKSAVYGNIGIDGKFSASSIDAALRMESAAQPETLHLNAVPKPHC